MAVGRHGNRLDYEVSAREMCKQFMVIAVRRLHDELGHFPAPFIFAGEAGRHHRACSVGRIGIDRYRNKAVRARRDREQRNRAGQILGNTVPLTRLDYR